MAQQETASLGLSVDSKPVEKATVDLTKLAGAAKQAETAAKGFEAGAAKAAAASQSLATQTGRAADMAQRINRSLNVRDTFGGADRAADVEAYGQALDDVRAKHNPLFAVQRRHLQQVEEINMALRTGALSQAEHTAAMARADVQARSATRAIALNEQAILHLGKQGLVTGFQMQNLAFQINDVATMAAMGADPLRILTSQAGQFYQVLSMNEGGARAAIADLGSRFLALLTPVRLATAGVLGFAGTAAVAAVSWASAQRDIELALMGTGAAAGLTSNAINRITLNAAAMGQATVGDAREVALALASTGRVAEENITRAIALSRNFQRVFGVDNAEAASILARALADPARGVDDMNRRLSAFDSLTTQHIKNLDAQGDRYRAQSLLIDGVNRSTAAASAATSGWSRAWTGLTETASQFWARFGSATARAVGIGPLTEQIRDAVAELERLQQRQRRMDPEGLRPGLANQIDLQIRRIRELQKAIISLNEEAANVHFGNLSRELDALVRSIVPDTQSLQGLINDWTRLNTFAGQSEVLSRLDPAVAANLQRSIELRRTQIAGFRTAIELAQEEFAFESRRIAARTPALQAQITLEETLARARRSGSFTEAEANQQAANAASLVLRRAAEDLTRSQEQRLLSSQQSVAAAQLELGLIGRTTSEMELQRALLQNRQQLEQEALRNYGSRDAFDRAHLAALNAESAKQAAINQTVRERQALLDVAFERAQLGRNSDEQQIFGRMQSMGMLRNGEIMDGAAAEIAAQMRLNQALQRNIDTSKEFASTFVRDMMAGKNATEALVNSLNRLADRLLDRAFDQFFSNMFSVGGPMRNASRGGLLGGMLLPGILHEGGVVGDDMPRRLAHRSAFAGARRYHGGGMPGLRSDEVPAILQKGEIVLPKGGGARAAPVQQPIIVNYHFSPGMTPADMAYIRTMIAEASRATEQRTVGNIRRAHQTDSAFLAG